MGDCISRSAMVACLALVGCGGPTKQDDAPGLSALRSWSALTTAGGTTRTKKLGEDCSEQGAAGCLDNLCIHLLPMPDVGHICSRPCLTAADCPDAWNCNSTSIQVQPFCVPSAEWTPRPVKPRRGAHTLHQVLDALKLDGGVR